jgi:hypothetical protein
MHLSESMDVFRRAAVHTVIEASISCQKSIDIEQRSKLTVRELESKPEARYSSAGGGGAILSVVGDRQVERYRNKRSGRAKYLL